MHNNSLIIVKKYFLLFENWCQNDICMILKTKRCCMRNARFKICDCIRELQFKVCDCMKKVRFRNISLQTAHFSCSHTSNCTYFMQSGTLNSNFIRQSRTLNRIFFIQHLFGFKITQILFLTFIFKQFFLTIWMICYALFKWIMKRKKLEVPLKGCLAHILLENLSNLSLFSLFFQVGVFNILQVRYFSHWVLSSSRIADNLLLEQIEENKKKLQNTIFICLSRSIQTYIYTCIKSYIYIMGGRIFL